MAASDHLLGGFGLNLRKARRAADMTQETLADVCGLERAYVSRLERGKAEPRIGTVVRLAQGLGVTASDLLAGIDRHPGPR